MILQHRKRLLRLMAIHDVSGRKLAGVAGYKSHSYMRRLLKGEVNTLDPHAALRIADFFQVPVDDLFLVRVTKNSGHTDPSGRAA